MLIQKGLLLLLSMLVVFLTFALTWAVHPGTLTATP